MQPRVQDPERVPEDPHASNQSEEVMRIVPDVYDFGGFKTFIYGGGVEEDTPDD